MAEHTARCDALKFAKALRKMIRDADGPDKKPKVEVFKSTRAHPEGLSYDTFEKVKV